MSSTSSSYRQIIVSVKEEALNAISGVLWQEGALGLEIEDEETRVFSKPQTFAYPNPVVKATFDKQPGLEARVSASLSRLMEEVFHSNDLEIVWSDVENKNWVLEVQSQWTTFSLGENIWLVPPWEEESFQSKSKDDVVLYLNPGMAFGTGKHETTVLCAQAVAKHMRSLKQKQISILDVGCGTGILAFVGLKLGAKKAVGTEIDQASIDISRENAIKNQLSDRFEVRKESPDFMGPVFDLVVANILANTLIILAKSIVNSLKPFGTLLLSGILKEQEQSVLGAYLPLGFSHKKTTSLGDWIVIALQKT